jgi:GT2 family glycosyltransferase
MNGQQVHSTIIIPNFNGIKYLEKCLASLRDEPAHIIVVDNGSTDGSSAIAAEKFPQVELVRLERNYGFCGAVNRGLELCKTTYVILLNNDTEVTPGFVRALEKPLQQDETIFSGSAQMRKLHQPAYIDDAGDYYCALGWAFALGKDKPAEGYQTGRPIFAACGGAAIYRTSILHAIGFMDENHFAYLEDIDLGYRAGIHGYRNLYIPEAVVYHAGSGSSGSRYNKFKVDLTSKNSVYLIYKNMPFVQILLNLPFLVVGFGVKTLFFMKKGYGHTYVRGLCKGIALCLSEKGRKHKVKFRAGHLPAYLRIQWELWRNILYRLLG